MVTDDLERIVRKLIEWQSDRERKGQIQWENSACERTVIMISNSV